MMTKKLQPYFYIAPAGIVIALVFFYPLIRIVQLSLQKTISGVPTFVGWRNFKFLLGDPLVAQALLNNAKLLLTVPILVFGCLIVAMLLFERLPGWKIFRTALFMPYLMSIVVVGTLFSYIYTLHGALNVSLQSIGLGFLAQDWLGTKNMVIPSVISVIVWREMGFGIVLYLARLMSINEELFEAAMLDGANWWQRLIYIAIPQVRGTMEFYAVIQVIMALSWVFDYVYVMTRGGPGTSSWVTEFYIYSMGFRYQDQGVASAMAIVLLAISVVLMFIRLQVSKRTAAYE
jgi:ABC-type sugar transport system permease subunit